MNPTIESRIEEQLTEIDREWSEIKPLPKEVGQLRTELKTVRDHVDVLRRAGLNSNRGERVRGRISDSAARNLGAHCILHLERCGKLDAVLQASPRRAELIRDAHENLGITHRYTGQTTTEFPLPTTYSSEVAMMIADYGVARNAMRNWPLGAGSSKPPRHKTGMTFGALTINSAITEKNPAYEFASLEPHKLGGIVITPRELFEDSIVDVGQYLAELGAYCFAQAEDTWAFLADGSATYDSVSGVCQIAETKSKLVTMSAGNTSPADATAANFANVLTKVNSKARGSGAWYLHNTWEAFLPELNTEANQYTFRYRPDGTALLYGRPIVWTEVLQSYTTAAAAATWIAVFGDLRFWWLGLRSGHPRIDVSSEVLFQYDQVSTRFLEELDVDYMADDAAAVLKTAAS